MYAAAADRSIILRRRPESGARRQGRRLLVGAGAFICLAFGLAQVAHGSSPSGYETIQVRPGDSVWSIAAERYPAADTRLKVDEIVKANHLEGGVLRVGEELTVPLD